MKRLLFSIVVLSFSQIVSGSSDLFFRFIKPIPRGDTDIYCVSVEKIYGERNSVILDKTLEVYRSDCGFIYYNLFYPEIANDSTLIIYKARIKIPRSFHFRHGRYGASDRTVFCFGNKREWFVLLFNMSFEEDSSGMIIYSEEEILEGKWQLYDNLSKNEGYYEEQTRHPKRSLSRTVFFSKKKRLYGLFEQKKNVLYFNVKSKHKKRGEALFSSFEIIDKRLMENPL